MVDDRAMLGDRATVGHNAEIVLRLTNSMDWQQASEVRPTHSIVPSDMNCICSLSLIPFLPSALPAYCAVAIYTG